MAAKRADSMSGMLILPIEPRPETARMTNDAPRLSLLEELDSRQNQLLADLDELNRRIETVLQSCLVGNTGLTPVPANA